MADSQPVPLCRALTLLCAAQPPFLGSTVMQSPTWSGPAWAAAEDYCITSRPPEREPERDWASQLSQGMRKSPLARPGVAWLEGCSPSLVTGWWGLEPPSPPLQGPLCQWAAPGTNSSSHPVTSKGRRGPSLPAP